VPIIIEPEGSRFDEPSVADFKAYIKYKKQLDELKKAQDIVKARLMEVVEKYGDEDDKGHYWFDLPGEVDGYVGMQRQKRISQKLNLGAAEDLLASKGLTETCIEMVPSVNEDAVMAAYYEGKLTEDDIDTMYPKSITWAFVPVKK
jgi:hypothetical protein